ncbi:hypothetical protein JY651_10240 [Pyxidicoccus parkwayensis]|uniref:Uncharacterized protein n=1 Tax=Pyxidicoccus parkwayensis TaxID=2813578 RepID=A0ABX7P474_9BACT|nr:hypothetical protein [Pyxidicoccus parkwaysis]QSQ25274.1 hypothetical protein JY651_10240 [Pyxidicoccus parkwaysis]
MPVVTVRARTKQRSVEFDALVRKATEKASDLLEQSDRVLVVYGKGSASIYYEGDGVTPAVVPSVRAS